MEKSRRNYFLHQKASTVAWQFGIYSYDLESTHATIYIDEEKNKKIKEIHYTLIDLEKSVRQGIGAEKYENSGCIGNICD